MLITIGQIVKPHGIRGELKVKPITDDINRFRKLKQVTVNEVPYEIKSMRIDGGFVYLALRGINDRNGAERLVGDEVKIDRIFAVDLDEGTYFIADVIGCKVFLDNGELIGEVSYIYQNGAADVYEVKASGTVLFPFLNVLIAEMDIDGKRIVLKKNEFDKVAVYED